MQSLNNLGALAGRILMGLIFTLSGLMKFTHLAGTVAMMEKLAGMSTMVYPQALAAAIIELGGGLLLMMGFHARAIALILFLFPIPVTTFPASAAGPDLREWVLGSEGHIGVLTEASVRVTRAPAAE